MSGLPQEEVDYQTSHLYEDETRPLVVFYSVCIIVVLSCMGFRIVSRKLTAQELHSDDYTFLVGAAIAQGTFIVLMIYSCRAGLGLHWIALSPDQKELFPKLNYAFDILAFISYPLIKVSILLLYRRVFITHRFQVILWICISFVAMQGIATTFVAIFSCNPVRGFFDSSVTSTCIDSPEFYWGSAILNVIGDFIILVLPMPMVWRLQISLQRKLAISLIFIFGGLTFVVSIIRIVYYLRFDPFDPSYSFIPDAYATAGEVCLAVICASMPTWRPVYRRAEEIARARFGSGRRSSDRTRSGRRSESRSRTLFDANEPFSGYSREPYYKMKSKPLRGSSSMVPVITVHGGRPSAESSTADIEPNLGETNVPLGEIRITNEVLVA